MTDNSTFNPLGTDGFEFVEYTAADEQGIENLKNLFKTLGFAEVAKHRSKEVWLYKQRDINFIVNAEPASQAEEFARLRGPSVCGMAFRVQNANAALQHALENGAKQFVGNLGPMELNIPAVFGIGESTLYFVDRYQNDNIYDVDFNFYPDWEETMKQSDAGLEFVDHLTHNVRRGNMPLVFCLLSQKHIVNFRRVEHRRVENGVGSHQTFFR